MSAPPQIAISHKDHPECFYPGCTRLRGKHGKLCQLHYVRKQKGTDMDAKPRNELDDDERWHKNGNGYMERHIKGTSPRRAELQHRVVMAEILGRDLLPHENVHHINGVRHDNRPENLELWTKSQPSGQRVEDKLAWAHALIDLYEK